MLKKGVGEEENGLNEEKDGETSEGVVAAGAGVGDVGDVAAAAGVGVVVAAAGVVVVVVVGKMSRWQSEIALHMKKNKRRLERETGDEDEDE